MALWKTHPREDLLRYLDGDVGDDRKRSIEEHLASCKECRDHISIVKGFNEGLTDLSQEEFASQEHCPDSWTLVSYEAGDVDEETARHLRAHLLFCDECAEEFNALRRLQPRVAEVILRVAGFLIEVVRPPEIATWESLLTTVPVRGEIVPSAPFQMAQTLIDDDGNKTRVAVQVELSLEPEKVRVIVEADKVFPEWRWSVALFDGKDAEWAGLPLDKPEVEVTSGIPFGLYALEVRKDEHSLGAFRFTVETITSDEALEKAREYLAHGEYVRAQAILKDVLRRDIKNSDLIQELNRAETLAAEDGGDEEGFEGKREPN
jgi:hypothetical protein